MKSMGIFSDDRKIDWESFDATFSPGYAPYGSVKKEKLTPELEMNIKRISMALHDVPRDSIEDMRQWIGQRNDLSDEEKRVVISIASKSRFKEDLTLANDYLENNIRRGEKESNSKYTERASSLLIEAYMSSNYRGFLKHLICSSLSDYRADGYSPEVAESNGEITDSLTGENIKQGEIYYDVISALGSHDQLKESSLEAIKRADLLMKKVWKSDYFYTR